MARQRRSVGDGQPDEVATTGPRRRCIVSGVVADRDVLVRFVVGPDGQVVPDVDERLPGRGFWLSARRDVVEKARTAKTFAKAARAPVSTPADLADRVERLLARRCQDFVGLARRGGQAVAGFERAREWVARGRAAVLMAARDGAAGGRAKLRAVAADLPVLEGLTGAELGAAFGRDHVVHVALAPGRLASAASREARRLEGFRPPLAEPRGTTQGVDPKRV